MNPEARKLVDDKIAELRAIHPGCDFLIFVGTKGGKTVLRCMIKAYAKID